MNPLEQALNDYIAIRRSLGFELRLPASSLRKFVAFLQAEGASYVTTELALRWAGMRVNEALSLDRHDVNLGLGILHIRRTKFGKSRHVPVHPSTGDALKKYAEARDRLFPAPSTPAFFLSESGSRVTEWTARYTFAKLSQQLGLRASAKGHVHVNDTYWYLEAVPELLQLATDRLIENREAQP